MKRKPFIVPIRPENKLKHPTQVQYYLLSCKQTGWQHSYMTHLYMEASWQYSYWPTSTWRALPRAGHTPPSPEELHGHLPRQQGFSSSALDPARWKSTFSVFRWLTVKPDGISHQESLKPALSKSVQILVKGFVFEK